MISQHGTHTIITSNLNLRRNKDSVVLKEERYLIFCCFERRTHEQLRYLYVQNSFSSSLNSQVIVFKCQKRVREEIFERKPEVLVLSEFKQQLTERGACFVCE